MWQKIETAPKDGSYVLASGWDYNRSGGTRHYAVVRWSDGGWREGELPWANDDEGLLYLTHWMPLPAPPAEE